MKAREITQKKALLCVAGVGCPSVFETDRKTLIIVGSIPANNDLPANIRRKMGKGEVAVEIPTMVLPAMKEGGS
jgi:hypothetical protein